MSEVIHWSQIVGNKHIKDIINNSINRGVLPSFILFTGTSGIGKSTFAEMTARAILCTNRNEETGEPCGYCDECLAISKNQSVTYKKINMPNLFRKSDVNSTIQEIFKMQKLADKTVYVLEEIHGLSKDLQTQLLEELTKIPKDVWIISCTTRPYDLLPEIVNRAVQFRLQDLTQKECERYALNLTREYGIELPDQSVLSDLVTQLRCNPRLIKQVIKVISTDNMLTEESLCQYFNIVDSEYVYQFLDMMFNERDLFKSIVLIQNLQESVSLPQLLRQSLEYIYDYVISVSGGLPICDTAIPEKLQNVYLECFSGIDKQTIVHSIVVLSQISLREEESKSSQKSKLISAKQKLERLLKKDNETTPVSNRNTPRPKQNVKQMVTDLKADTQIKSALELEKIIAGLEDKESDMTHEFRPLD